MSRQKMMNKELKYALENATLDEIVAFAIEQWNADEIAEKLMELSSLSDKEKLRSWVAGQVADAMG